MWKEDESTGWKLTLSIFFLGKKYTWSIFLTARWISSQISWHRMLFHSQLHLYICYVFPGACLYFPRYSASQNKLLSSFNPASEASCFSESNRSHSKTSKSHVIITSPWAGTVDLGYAILWVSLFSLWKLPLIGTLPAAPFILAIQSVCSVDISWCHELTKILTWAFVWQQSWKNKLFPIFNSKGLWRLTGVHSSK